MHEFVCKLLCLTAKFYCVKIEEIQKRPGNVTIERNYFLHFKNAQYNYKLYTTLMNVILYQWRVSNNLKFQFSDAG